MKVKENLYQLHVTMAIDHSKKLTIVSKLLLEKYKDQLEDVMCDDNKTLMVIFRNKPDQIFNLQFPAFDTWDQIKRKMDKLMESDGICVVCCEMERTLKREEVPCRTKGCTCKQTRVSCTRPTGYCGTCCEMLCKTCWSQMTTMRCPVCRSCSALYRHKLDNVECHCDSDSD